MGYFYLGKILSLQVPKLGKSETLCSLVCHENLRYMIAFSDKIFKSSWNMIKLKDGKRSQLPYLHQSNQQKRHNFWQFFVAPQRIWSNRLMSSILVADLLLWFPPSWLEKKSFDGNQTMKFIPDPWKLNLAWAAFCRNINITWNLLFSHSTPMIFAQNTFLCAFLAELLWHESS